MFQYFPTLQASLGLMIQKVAENLSDVVVRLQSTAMKGTNYDGQVSPDRNAKGQLTRSTDVNERGSLMAIKFQSCRATMPDRWNVSVRHEAASKTQSRLTPEKLVRDSLIMFLDLGLTPREMSKLSGFPPMVIEDGLKRLGE
jgi:hypothetical protein